MPFRYGNPILRPQLSFAVRQIFYFRLKKKLIRTQIEWYCTYPVRGNPQQEPTAGTSSERPCGTWVEPLVMSRGVDSHRVEWRIGGRVREERGEGRGGGGIRPSTVPLPSLSSFHSLSSSLFLYSLFTFSTLFSLCSSGALFRFFCKRGGEEESLLGESHRKERTASQSHFIHVHYCVYPVSSLYPLIHR